jgi:hypothetical protein
MPAAAALKALLTVAYLLFFLSCVTVSRQLGSDPRLHWLFVPTFFGFCWKWGFFPISAGRAFWRFRCPPRLSNIRAKPEFRTGIWIAVWGIVLFFLSQAWCWQWSSSSDPRLLIVRLRPMFKAFPSCLALLRVG